MITTLWYKRIQTLRNNFKPSATWYTSHLFLLVKIHSLGSEHGTSDTFRRHGDECKRSIPRSGVVKRQPIGLESKVTLATELAYLFNAKKLQSLLYSSSS